MHQKFKLNNGITVVHQPLMGYKSLSIGVWIKVGAAYETAENNGISHFIEHMVFKGTKSYTAKDISLIIDGVGGEINAYTAKECTCFYTKTLGEHMEIALNLLSEMVFFPTFEQEHIDVEKVVIEDEINMYEDSAEELVSDLLQTVTFGNHALSRPILGTKETIGRFTKDDLLAYYKTYYTPENIMISICGNYDTDKIEQIVGKYFERPFPVANSNRLIKERPTFNTGYVCSNKENEQIQVSLDFPGIPFEDPSSYDMTLLSNVLGGTNSSLLFQEIREEKGLSYSIYSEPCFYDEVGTLNISFGASKENVDQIMGLIFDIIRNRLYPALNPDTLNHAKDQLKGSVVLGMEGTEHVMDWIGRIELFAHTEKDMDAVIKKIDAISLEGVQKLYKKVFESGAYSLAIVGDISEKDVKKLYKKYGVEV